MLKKAWGVSELWGYCMLLALKEACFGYDDKLILENISAELHESDRIGLVGGNGEGKTTLLNLLTGELSCTEGEALSKRSLRLGYLKQNAGLESGLSVYDEAKRVYAALFETEEKLRLKEAELAQAEGKAYSLLAQEYDALTKAFEAADGYGCDVRIKTVLNGMGFGGRYQERVDHLSGGEKTRLALCKLLLESPELLILDEPTNHLDFDALMWLSKYLESYSGALLVVSHDRYFLDKTVTKIWDLQDRQLSAYGGNYTKYRELKRDRLARQLKEYEKQQNQIESMLDYAQRNIARATTANSAKSRLHRLEHIERIEKPVLYRKQAVFRFEYDRESVKEVLSVKDLRLEVPGKLLAEKVAFDLLKGDRLAIVGKNGTGKSTLIKSIAGLRESYGRVVLGKNVKIAYYDQENLNLDASHTVLEELWHKNHRLSQTEIRAMLARMLLFAEDTEKSVASLSGGERAKLGFAVTISQRGNLLLLDEPTNHLDLEARESLEDGLIAFAGSMIFVSHDVYFLNKLATRVLEIEDGKITVYNCGFEKYRELKDETEKIKEVPVKAAKKALAPSGYRSAEQRAAEVERKRNILQTEKEIETLENETLEINEIMSSGELASNYIELSRLCERLEQIKTRLNELYDIWEKLHE